MGQAAKQTLHEYTIDTYASAADDAATEAAGKIGNEAMAEDIRHLRMDHEGAGDVNQVEGAERQRQLFPGPIAALHNHNCHNYAYDQHGDWGRNVKNTHCRGHADKFRNQSQPVG